MKVAIVHDWITGMRGGEWCLEAFLLLYPEADIFTLVHIPGVTTERIDSRVKAVSWLSRLPSIKKYYRALLPFFPFAIRGFNFEGYDCVISISHAAAKNIRVPQGTTHVCYCLTPMRYIWDQAKQYLKQFLPLFWPLIKILRVWDCQGSQSVTQFIGISKFVSARIRHFYGRKSSVVYPPVASRWLSSPQPKPYQEPYFLIASALVPYKRVELAVTACTKSNMSLVVAGGGPLLENLKKIAGKTIIFEGRVSDLRLAALYQHCRAFLFLPEEDFGIMPLECLAAGRPVIARFVGAARETILGIRPWSNLSKATQEYSGMFMQKAAVGSQQEVGALTEALCLMSTLDSKFSSPILKLEAAKYGPKAFYDSWCRAVGELLKPSLDGGTFVTAFENARMQLK